MAYLKDDDGNESSMRLAFWLIVAVFWSVWSYCSIFASGGPQLVPVPEGIVNIMITAFSAKFGQKFLAESDVVSNVIAAFTKDVPKK